MINSNKPRIRLSQLRDIKLKLRKNALHTVCEEARCPNIGVCFSKKTATVLVMGNICTRKCRFCNIESGKPKPLDKNEPKNILKLVKKLELKYVVITSVTRDDLADGGASHYRDSIREIKNHNKEISVEVLTPDFLGNKKDLNTVLNEDICVFNHNVETVPSNYEKIRPGASFFRSLEILAHAKGYSEKYLVKTGFMLGLGEKNDEVYRLIEDLAKQKIDILTIGQYYRPSKKHADQEKTYNVQEFHEFARFAFKKGIKTVFSAPNVRSSFRAEEIFSSDEKEKNLLA